MPRLKNTLFLIGLLLAAGGLLEASLTLLSPTISYEALVNAMWGLTAAGAGGMVIAASIEL